MISLDDGVTELAVVTDVTGSTIGTYRTTDGGDSWTSLPGADTVSFGWWFGQIRVDPTDWRRVWTPWLDLYRSTTAGTSWQYQSGTMHVDHHALWIDPADPSRMIAGNDGGVYSSADRGRSWRFRRRRCGRRLVVAVDLQLLLLGCQDLAGWHRADVLCNCFCIVRVVKRVREVPPDPENN